MDRVLVTGGSGLIGRSCLPLLIRSGYEVHALTRTPPARHNDVQWHRGNLLEPRCADNLLDRIQPTHLLHLAWYTDPGLFWTSVQNRDWLEASLRLFCKFEQSGGRRIVAAGSCAEYDWTGGICREISTPCRPATLYGRTKLAAATYLDTMNLSEGLHTAWARLFFLYGPHANPSRMPGVVISALSRGVPVECSAGTQRRDFLFVPDAADAIVTLLRSDVTGPVNICSGQAVSIRDLAQRTADLMNRPDLLRLGANANSFSEPPLIVGDPGRLANELNWKPCYSLDDGLRCTVEAMAGPSSLQCA